MTLALVTVGLVGCSKDEPQKPEADPPATHNPSTQPSADDPASLEAYPIGPAMGGATPAVEITAAHLAAYLAGVPGQGKLSAIIETDFGAFTCELYEAQTPKTVANFVGLARGVRPFMDHVSGKVTKRPYFDGTPCHRVIPGFMMQCGDPTATGMGGPGYRFADEFVPSLRHDRAGILSMANAGPTTNGSQFFITEGPTPGLNDKHTVFGRCDPGSLVRTITNVPKDPSDGSGSRPAKPVLLNRVSIVRR